MVEGPLRIDLQKVRTCGCDRYCVSPEYPLLGFVSLVAPAVIRGNTVVAVPSRNILFVDLYQVLDTSDLPGGVLNIVTGSRMSVVFECKNSHSFKRFTSNSISGTFENIGGTSTCGFNNGIMPVEKRVWRKLSD